MAPKKKHTAKPRSSSSVARPSYGDDIRQIFGIIALVVVGLGIAAVILFPQLRAGGSAKNQEESSAESNLIVLAAASLTQPLTEAVHSYERADSSAHVQLSCGSSNSLRRQIERGAPVDLYLSASPEHTDALVQHGWVKRQDLFSLWTTELVLVASPTTTVPTNLKDALLRARRIAIGDLGVPVGDYARQALQALGLTDRLKEKLIPMLDERAVLSAVASGACDLGIAYAAGVDSGQETPRLNVVATFPPETHDPIRYTGAILSDAKHPAKARALLRFLTTGKGKESLIRAGFSSSADSR
jgi:molybdate transport system substrate-binding protein